MWKVLLLVLSVLGAREPKPSLGIKLNKPSQPLSLGDTYCFPEGQPLCCYCSLEKEEKNGMDIKFVWVPMLSVLSFVDDHGHDLRNCDCSIHPCAPYKIEA